MPRQVRIQYPGAVYHLMCRGDRREAIFRSDSDRQTFLTTLAEACGRSGMVIHSYVLMGNHYHLLAQTPEPNLVATMQWLQGTYTQRFNLRHRLSGHLFQGRYKAIPVEAEAGYFAAVSDYIHLNPVRARMVERARPHAGDYPWSSCGPFAREAKLPDWLRRSAVFGELDLPDEGAGSRRRYRAWMGSRTRDALEREPSEEESRQWKELRRGWYLGSESFRDRLMDWASGVVAGRQRRSFGGEGLRTHDEREAGRLLAAALDRLGLKEEEVRRLRKNDARKQGLAWLIRSRTVIEDQWVMGRLNMGHRSNVGRAVAAFRDPADAARRKLRKVLHICAD